MAQDLSYTRIFTLWSTLGDGSVLKHACAQCLNKRNDANLREPAVNQFRKISRISRIMHSYMYRSYQGSRAPGLQGMAYAWS